MSQSARPFDDSLGDASGQSPYDDSALSAYLLTFGNFVIPETSTSQFAPLAVSSAGAGVGEIRISAGKAWVNGVLYISDALVTKTLDAAVNNRIDRVVLRYTAGATQTVRIAIIKGAEAANPSPPNILSSDMAVAQVWVPAGFNPAADTVDGSFIYDERVFFPTGEHENLHGSINLMPNSEFLAVSNVSGVWPVGWRTYGAAPTAITPSAPLTNQPRGRSIRIQTAANGRGMQTILRVGVGYYTLRGTLKITSGTAGVYVYLAGSTYASLKTFNRTGANTEYIIRFYSDRQQDLTVALISNTGDVYFGQVLLTRGFRPGFYRHEHETIMLDNALTDASWTATAKSTSSTLIDLSASFGSLFSATSPIRGVILRLKGNDSGSGGGADIAKMSTSLDGTNALSILRLGRVTNDKIRDVIGFAPMVGGLGYTFYLDVVATGAGTFDATVEIIGIIT